MHEISRRDNYAAASTHRSYALEKDIRDWITNGNDNHSSRNS